MTKIEINHLTYYYDDFYHPVFNNLSCCLDTDRTLALIGAVGEKRQRF